MKNKFSRNNSITKLMLIAFLISVLLFTCSCGADRNDKKNKVVEESTTNAVEETTESTIKSEPVTETTESTTSIQNAIVGTYYSDIDSYEKVVVENDQILVDVNLLEARATVHGSYEIDGERIICGELLSDTDVSIYKPGLRFYYDSSANKLTVYNGDVTFCLTGWSNPKYLADDCTFSKK